MVNIDKTGGYSSFIMEKHWQEINFLVYNKKTEEKRKEISMKYRWKLWLGMIVSLMVIYIILISSVNFFCFNRSFYHYEYGKLETAKQLGMSDAALDRATDTLLDYLQDQRDDIKIREEIYGWEREVFNERETLHMVDVKNLYQGVLSLRNLMIVLATILAVFLFLENRSEFWEVMSAAYLRTAIGCAFVLGLLLMYAIADFTTFWTNFHKVFFTNDLWLLNPNTSIMINMFPETFFHHLVLLIGSSAMIVFVFCFIASVWYQRKLRIQFNVSVKS